MVTRLERHRRPMKQLRMPRRKTTRQSGCFWHTAADDYMGTVNRVLVRHRNRLRMGDVGGLFTDDFPWEPA